jgi:predicted permease
MSRVMTWWRQIVGRARTDRELAHEIQAHIAERVDDLVERGMSSDEARRTALQEFGNPVRCLEESRSVWLIPWLVNFGQDVRYVLRTIRRQPIFSASVVLILTLGIGLVTALFTVFSATVLRPWPVPDPSSIVVITPRPASGEQYGTLSSLEYRYFREHARSFSHLSSSLGGGSPVGRSDGTMFATLQSQCVTANYFDALRIGMTIGRGFLPEEEDYASPRAIAVISERVWREYFASDPGLVGSPIRVGEQTVTVVGVAERGFADVRGSIRVDVWLPLTTVGMAYDRKSTAEWLRTFDNPRRGFSSRVFGRLRPGVTAAEALAELDVLSRQFRSAYAMEAPGVRLADTRPLSADNETVRRDLPAQSLMFVALLLVMLLACANAGNLVLAKTVARRDEIAIRLSLGASQSRVARQLITEVLVLSLVAGLVALYLAATVPSLLIRLSGNEIRNDAHLAPDAFVFLFTLLMSMVACAFASLGPVLRVTRAAAIGSGKDRALAGPSSHRLRVSLLATQIALSTVLLLGAALLTRAVTHAMSLDPGFAVAEIQQIGLEMPRGASADALPRIREILTTAGLPPTAFSSLRPITTARTEIGVRQPNQQAEKNRRLVLRPVSASYFGVLGIRFLTGRPFGDRVAGRELVISESAARLLWPNEDPIGKRLLTGDSDKAPEPHEIVGVVADVATTTLTEVEPVIYQPMHVGNVVLVRDLSPAVSARIKDLVESAVPGASSYSRPLIDEIRDSLKSLILGSRVAWVLGGLALVLAMLGAFGVFAAMVEERRHEIGVRMALGARGSQVVQLVLGGATGPVLAGLAAGLALSLMVTPLLRRALYGLSPFDPIAYLEIAAILLASSLAATWIPAARATRVEPAITLRGD